MTGRTGFADLGEVEYRLLAFYRRDDQTAVPFAGASPALTWGGYDVGCAPPSGVSLAHGPGRSSAACCWPAGHPIAAPG
jgi:hypothetical protein